MKTLKKGFTLIELLIVVAIIGILATVVILNVSGARQKAQTSKAKELASGAAKIANACISFGGDIATWTDPSTGGGDICGTAPTGTDKDDSAGSYKGPWPSLASTSHTYAGYSHTAGASDFSFTIVDKDAALVATCTNSGCN